MFWFVSLFFFWVGGLHDASFEAVLLLLLLWKAVPSKNDRMMVSILQPRSMRAPTVKKRFKHATETSRELMVSSNKTQTLFKAPPLC
jgi:hypothetical protein